MDTTAILVIIGTLVLIGVAGIVLWRQGHPEGESSFIDEDRHEGPTGTPYPPGSRPAGPGAEGMSPTERGRIVPGRPGTEPLSESTDEQDRRTG